MWDDEKAMSFGGDVGINKTLVIMLREHFVDLFSEFLLVLGNKPDPL